jgi:hypothetical protein
VVRLWARGNLPSVTYPVTLIEKVRRGEIKPTEADSEAKRLGFGTLAREPDPANFDPMQEPHWSLPMAVAWIAYRSIDAVRNWWDEYRKECWDWHFREWRVGPDGPVRQGYFLEQRSKATLVLLKMTDVWPDQTGLISVAEAIDALWLVLQSGDLEVTGINEDTGRRVPIPGGAMARLNVVRGKGPRRDLLQTGARPQHGSL